MTVRGGRAGLAKGQVHEVMSEEIKHKLQELCPRGVTQDVLIAPGMSCENTCEMLCACEARQGLSAQGLSWGLVILVPSAGFYPECRPLEGRGL